MVKKINEFYSDKTLEYVIKNQKPDNEIAETVVIAGITPKVCGILRIIFSE